MTTSQKIINWAASESNGHGAHIEALNHALTTDLNEATRKEVEQKRTEWVLEHNARFVK